MTRREKILVFAEFERSNITVAEGAKLFGESLLLQLARTANDTVYVCMFGWGAVPLQQFITANQHLLTTELLEIAELHLAVLQLQERT